MRNCLRYFLFVILATFWASSVVSASGPVIGSNPILVTDIVDDLDIAVKKFRTTKNLANKNLSDLNVSASGQFSAYGLKNIFSMVSVSPAKIWIIDIRQESHGFINGTPVSWYSTQNRGNVNKAPEKISIEEKALLDKLSNLPEIKVYTVKKLPDGEITAGEEIVFIPYKVETEQELVTGAGANYLRLYVLDHNRPDDREVETFVTFIKSKVKPGEWLHFHCRGGKGRSSTFMAMYDMTQNAQHSTLDQIMRRQMSMGNVNFYKLPATADKLWKLGSATARYEFLEKFYQYCSDPNGFAKRGWREWLKLNLSPQK